MIQGAKVNSLNLNHLYVQSDLVVCDLGTCGLNYSPEK